MRTNAVLLAIALAGTRLVSAQGNDLSSPAQDIRKVVIALKAAADRRDWPAMQPYFPVDRPLGRLVSSLVTTGEPGYAASFWKADARPELEKFEVQVIASDIVAVSLPFTLNGASAFWGAVFTQIGDRWQLHCTMEIYGPASAPRPGCVSS